LNYFKHEEHEGHEKNIEVVIPSAAADPSRRKGIFAVVDTADASNLEDFLRMTIPVILLAFHILRVKI
jgi:hypothetical protein